MPVANLTSAFVRRAVCPDGAAKIDFFDAEQTGFMLQVRSTGRKTFYQRYLDSRGREKQYKIGPADVLTVEQARRKAKEVRAEALLGDDPQGRRQELRSIETLREFADKRYLPFVKEYKRSWQTDEHILRLHILPSLGNLSLDEVTGEHISNFLRRLRVKGYAVGTINRTLILLRYIFNLAREWKAVPSTMENPTATLSVQPEKHRERYLSDEEGKRLIDALVQDRNRVAADAILLLLLTGGRFSEITKAKWSYLDWERQTLLVPLSKSGKPRHIHLNSHAMDVLRSITPRPGTPYIFASPKTGRPSPSMSVPWKRIKKRAGLNDVRLHDLRHSYASYLVNSGVSLYVVQALLGHQNIKHTQRYAHLNDQTLSEAAELAGTIVNRMAGGQTGRVETDPLETPEAAE